MESKIKTYEDACNFIGQDPNALPDVSRLPEKHQKYLLSNYQLVIITEALNKEYSIKEGLNEEWKPNWNDHDQYKYFPCFNVDSSGFGFSFTYYGHWFTGTDVGSRLCFPTSELALYSGNQFKDLHIENQLIKP